jgi:hypothetical protein
MLNGAAGHTYGAAGVWEPYDFNQPFQREKWSFLTWREGMKLPGSYEVGLGAKLLRHYPWWRFEPHPEWVVPHGTTMLEPRQDALNQFQPEGYQSTDPLSEWQKRNGDFHLPYAAGIPREVRFIYMQYFGPYSRITQPPTVLHLEPEVRYHAYFWDPSVGTKIDLGAVERPLPGKAIPAQSFAATGSSWIDYGAKTQRTDGKLSTNGNSEVAINGVQEVNVTAGVKAHAEGNAGLLLRFHDVDNYLAAAYSAKKKVIYLLDREKGVDGDSLGVTAAPDLGPDIHLTAEVNGRWAVVSVTDGPHTYTSEIVHIDNPAAGSAGLIHSDDGVEQQFSDFELRRSLPLTADEHLERALYDANGQYRGRLAGGGSATLSADGVSSWNDFGREKIVLLDAYRPERLPYGRDWILVLENQH